MGPLCAPHSSRTRAPKLTRVEDARSAPHPSPILPRSALWRGATTSALAQRDWDGFRPNFGVTISSVIPAVVRTAHGEPGPSNSASARVAGPLRRRVEILEGPLSWAPRG